MQSDSTYKEKVNNKIDQHNDSQPRATDTKYVLEMKSQISSNEKKFDPNIKINNRRVHKFENLKEFVTLRENQVKDILFYLVEAYGDQSRKLLDKLRNQCIEELIAGTKIPELSNKKVQEEFLEELDKSLIDYDKYPIEYGAIIAWIYYALVDCPSLKNSETVKKYCATGDDYLRYSETFDHSIQKTMNTVFHDYSYLRFGINKINDIYNDVIFLDDSSLKGVKLANTLKRTINSLENILAVENDNTKLHTKISLDLDGSKFNLELYTLTDLILEIKILIPLLFGSDEEFISLQNTFERNGISKIKEEPIFTTSQILVVYDITYQQLEENSHKFTNQELELIHFYQTDSKDDYVFLEVVDQKKVSKPYKASLEQNTTLCGAMLTQLHKYLWVKNQVMYEEKNTPVKDLKNFRKNVSKLYYLYGQLFDEYIDPNRQEIHEYINVSDSGIAEHDEHTELSSDIPKIRSHPSAFNLNQYGNHIDQLNLLSEANSSVTISDLHDKLYAITGEDIDLKKFSLPQSQINIIDTLLNKIDSYISSQEDISRINYELSNFIKYGCVIPDKGHQAQKYMKFGNKEYQNAIKININSKDRLVIYTHKNEVKILFLSGSEYHDSRTK